MTCDTKVPLANISNLNQTSNRSHSLSFLEFIIPSLPLRLSLDAQPHLDRPSTPLGFCSEDDTNEQDQRTCSDISVESTCTRLVSEAWTSILTTKGEDENDETSHITAPAPQTKLLSSLVQQLSPPSRQIHVLPPRLRYHGHSKSALMDYKVFWNARYEEWSRWQTELEEVEMLAYDGIRKSTLRNSQTRQPAIVPKSGYTPGRYRGEYIPDIQAPIYPRTGNLASLRQPAALERERWFVGFPLHKIHRILFAYDMDHRFGLEASSKENKEKTDIEDVREGDSFVSDDTTLVEEPLDLGKWKEVDELSAPTLAAPRYQEAGAWEVDWGVKWELLVALIQGHEENVGDLSDACKDLFKGDIIEEEEEDSIIYTGYDGFDELLIC